MRLGQGLDSLGIAADEDRIGHHPVAIGEQHAALVADGHDRADQVLVQTHAPGHAVHDDAGTASVCARLAAVFVANSICC